MKKDLIKKIVNIVLKLIISAVVIISLFFVFSIIAMSDRAKEPPVVVETTDTIKD